MLLEKKLVKAVQNVAESIGGDVKETESELLTKLLNPIKADKTSISTNIRQIFVVSASILVLN